MATMGELAASIAHEMNNPLATISLRLESLLGKYPEGDPRRREMEVIEQEIDRMARLVSALLQFSRRTQKFVSTVNIEEEVEKTIDLIYYHMRKQNIKIVRDFSPDIPHIQGDRQQLIQLFLNLLTNASDAMPEGGILKISISLSQEKQMVIEVSDTGSGIQPDILTRIMEPFFTTKGEGKGTGLGLSICKRIVEEHEGTIHIESSGVPGKGTTIRIVLPVSNKVNVNHLKG
jgi:signal transduction histidine kinase